MGYNTHRIAEPGQCSSDFCIHGLQYLFDHQLLDKDSIDALILVTQSPDYYMPATSNLIQGHFNMKHDMICLDINQGCAGFEIGLIQAFMLLDQEAINKVVLLNADVLSPKKFPSTIETATHWQVMQQPLLLWRKAMMERTFLLLSKWTAQERKRSLFLQEGSGCPAHLRRPLSTKTRPAISVH